LIALAIIIFILAVYLIFKSSLSVKRKQFFISLAFCFLSFVLIYSGFEAYFRYRFDESDSLGFLNVTQRWYGRHVVYNNFQYRDKDFTVQKKPGTVRIGVIGDSNTFGYGIKNVNNRFSNILEDKLNNAGYKVEVYNFGVPGLDTWNEIIEYNKKDAIFKPDILIWQYFLNDVEATKSAGTIALQNAGNQISPLVKLISDHSVFFNYVYWRLSAKYSTTFSQISSADLKQYSNPKVFAFHKYEISSLMTELKDQNIKVIVTVFPFFGLFPNYPAGKIHQEMDTIFKNDGADVVVDLLPYLKNKTAKELVVGRYDSHPNESVHKLAADKLYDAVVPLLEKTKQQGTIVKTNEESN